ncbi:hypothetical protein JXI42_11940 [bacterium]|nr:hypothetical protein [bacterium]
MIFWAMVLFVFGLAYLLDCYNPILSGFMKQISAILVMLIAIGILYRDLQLRKAKSKKTKKQQEKAEN